MTNKNGEIKYITQLTTTEIIKVFNEIVKKEVIEKIQKTSTNTEYRNVIRKFIQDNAKSLSVNILKKEKKNYEYERTSDGKLMVYINSNNKLTPNVFQNIEFSEDETLTSAYIDEKSDLDSDDEDEDDKDKQTTQNRISQEQSQIEESIKKAESDKQIQNNITEMVKQHLGIDDKKDKKHIQQKDHEIIKKKPEWKNIKAEIPEEKTKPQEQTKIQKFKQYKKVTRQNLTDAPKKVKIQEKTETQITNETKQGMSQHLKKQENAFQKYAQGHNHMTRFNTNMAEALKKRINQGFSPFS
jgi:hypothetical protein